MTDKGSRGVESVVGPEWVDEVLLAGEDSEICLVLDSPIDRITLRRLVGERQARLAASGLSRGGSVALRLPPSLSYVVNLLAAWRIGAQVTLLDHRLTAHEIDRALERVLPQVVVAPEKVSGGALRAFVDVVEAVHPYPGRPATTDHAVIQLSSGSTGPSKVIGRTAGNLVAEIERYTRIDGVPLPGERVVLLASMVHVLGLVGGLLYGLHAGVELVLPGRMTVDGILKAVAAGDAPTTLIGVPFHIELLASTNEPLKLPQLKRMTTGGELVRPEVSAAFVDRYDAILGNMYGMTEVGVIGTDLYGAHRPSIRPAPGIEVAERDGELWIGMPASPYLGLSDPTRWVDGWLCTKDAGSVDEATGLVTVRGRNDSQVSVGGLKVDLTEVEHTLAALPGVAAAVVVHAAGIEAYVQLGDPSAAAGLEGAIAERLAPFKRPKTLHLVRELPRTATGKLVRDAAQLRGAAPADEA